MRLFGNFLGCFRLVYRRRWVENENQPAAAAGAAAAAVTVRT